MKRIERVQHWIVYRDTPCNPHGRRMKLRRHFTKVGAIRHAYRVGGYVERYDPLPQRREALQL